MHSLRLLLPSPSPPAAAQLQPHHRRNLTAVSAVPTAAPDITIEKQPAAPPHHVDTPSAAYWDYQFLFLSQRSEARAPVPLRPVVGSLPSRFPRGSYFLTGPGLFADDHGSTVHPLDGHGYLRAFEFHENGAASYSARYITTEAQREEMGGDGDREDDVKFTHRGPFSVLRGGKKVGNVKVMKNVANTSVVRWGGKVMCLWEGGDPYEVDGRTLETVGTVDLVGRREEETVEDRKAAKDGGDLVEMLKEVGVDVAAGFLKPILHGN